MNKVLFLTIIHLDKEMGEIRSNDRMSLANRTQDEFIDLEALFRPLTSFRCIN
ncbi:hypothetical protein [Natranaerofaba carboxydovora]|uniref:hypothetical protein n=1 Tax=Natranaerofaba carboxydovora TaxID=2742683 RepID=UPI001F140CBB|nr:hypothetical protein [Natranaerofaba carboxydovora]